MRKSKLKLALPAIVFILLLTAGCNKEEEPVIGTVTDVQGNEYPTIRIGDQRWMAENLKATKYRDGSDIEFIGDDTIAWSNNLTGAYTWYNNDETNFYSYGPLYNWYAVNNSKGICPKGWRVSTSKDWAKLVNFLMKKYDVPHDTVQGQRVGLYLKSCRMVNSPLGGECATDAHPRWNYHELTIGTDDVGFSAYPGGDRIPTGTFTSQGEYGFWWAKSDSDSEFYGRYYYINFDRDYIFNFVKHKNFGLSVRCIRE